MRTKSSSNHSVVVVGGGLAGCHIAFELATRDVKVILVDACDSVAGGASGNSASIVKPFVTRSPGQSDQFYHRAFDFLLNRFNTDKRLRTAAQFTQCGVLQLFEHHYPDNPAYTSCTAQQASALAGVHIDSPAVFFKQGGWLNPAALCEALTLHEKIDIRLNHNLRSIRKTDGSWLIELEQNAGPHRNRCTQNSIVCDTLVLANGPELNTFSQTRDLPISAARGQASQFNITNGAELKTVVTGKRYAIPNGKQVVVGASFIRGNKDRQLSANEHRENLAGLHTLLPSLELSPTAQSGFCAIRATTPDRLPVVGPMPDLSSYRQNYARVRDGIAEHRFPKAVYEQGLFIIGGFGSRGVVSTPYCAKLLVDYLTDSPDANDATKEATREATRNDSLSGWSALLHPARFTIRELRRARCSN